jgi:uncharacterized protein
MSVAGSALAFPESDNAIIASILAPAQPIEKHGIVVNEGYRCLCLGETGSGKTSLMRAIVYATIAQRLANFALIHDAKGIFPEYRHSVQLTNVRAFVERKGMLPGEMPVYSFRGDVRRDIAVSAEEVAALSRFLGKKGRVVNDVWLPNSHLCVIEEVSEASTAGRKHLKAPSVLWIAEQGRKVGVSLLGTTQSPRKIPLDLLGQASSVAFFRLTGADANYLGERLELNPTMVQAIRGPQGEGLPNYDYVLWNKGAPWDGQIHRLDKHTATMFE